MINDANDGIFPERLFPLFCLEFHFLLDPNTSLDEHIQWQYVAYTHLLLVFLSFDQFPFFSCLMSDEFMLMHTQRTQTTLRLS